MEYFSYKVGCGMEGVIGVLGHLEEELAWTIDKHIWVISNIMPKTVIPLRN